MCLDSYLNPEDCDPARITKADEDFLKRLDIKDIKLPLKTRDIKKFKKKNCIDISVFGFNKRVKYPIYLSKKYFKEKHYVLIKNSMFLSKISIHLCLIIHYIFEKNIFIADVCKLLELQKIWNVILKIALKLMINKLLGGLKRMNILNLKFLEEKQNHLS